MSKRAFFLTVWVLVSAIAFGQNENLGKPLYLKSGIKYLPKNIEQLESADLSKHSINGVAWIVLQFKDIPQPHQVQELEHNGIKLFSYLPKHSYLAQIVLPANSKALQLSGARAFYLLQNEDKVDAQCYSNQLPGEYIIHFYGLENSNELEQIINKPIDNEAIKSGYIKTENSPELIARIANLPFVWSIENHIYGIEFYNRDIQEHPNSVKSNVLNASGFSGAENLSGKGISALIVDAGFTEYHPDFNNRLINTSTLAIQSFREHSELVSGVFGGAGNLSPYNSAGAYKSSIYSMIAFERASQYNLLDHVETYYVNNDVRITTNSYGSTNGNYGRYTLYSSELDEICRSNPELINISSASNDGQVTNGSYPQGFHTVTDNFQSAKNSFTVGNVSIYDSIMPSSSKGPTYDGRIKPEFCGNGSHINRVSKGNDYTYSLDGGTSSACPNVGAAAALLLEYYKRENGVYPSAALIKNVLANTADDLGNPGPDFTYGYGRINARRALEVLKEENYYSDSVANNATITTTISVPSGVAQLNVMLTWLDIYGANLINDLDLELVSPSNQVFYPWRLKHNAVNVTDNATKGRDSINNIEQVSVISPSAGTWTIRIIGETVIQGKQAFATTWQLQTPDIELTYPIGNEKLGPGLELLVKWDAYDISANAFTLEYTVNNGTSWTTIDNNIPSTQRYYEWTVPSVSSGDCKVRVSRNGTSKQSQSKATFVIAAIPQNLSTTSLCTDYARVQWSAVSGAVSYNVYKLDTFMKLVSTVTGTSDTVALSQDHDDNWISVSANFNGFEGQRAYASRPMQSNSNQCPFDYDLSVVAITNPVSGRKDHSDELTSTQQITIKCVNKGTQDVSSFQLKYSVNGGNIISQSYSNTLSSGDTLTHTFSTTANMSNAGVYNVVAWVEHANDIQNANDSSRIQVEQYPNASISLPYIENFEIGTTPLNINTSTKSIGNYPALDFECTTDGQLRYSSLDNGVYLESRLDGNDATNYLTFNLNCSAIATKSFVLRFKYTQFLEQKHDNDKLWIRGADTDSWIEILDLYEAFRSAYDVEQTSEYLNITDLLEQYNQSLSKTTQIRFGQQDNSTAKKTQFPNVGSGGTLLSYFELVEMGPDLVLDSIVSPIYHNDGYVGNTQITIKVRNTYHQAISNVPVAYQFGSNSAVTETIASIPANSVKEYTFSTRFNYTARKHYSLKTWVAYGQDTFNVNDTLSLDFYNSARQYGYPYTADFETTSQFFWQDGQNSSWEYGAPNAANISSAYSGSKAWVTRLTGIHNQNELSYLNTPVFYTSSFGTNDLILSFYRNQHTQNAYVEYSTNGGNWHKLGAYGEGENWYDDIDDNEFDATNGWEKSSYVVSNSQFANTDKIKFRFVFDGNTGFNWGEGLAIDLVEVNEVEDDVAITELVTPYTNCGWGSSENITVKVANQSGSNLSNIPIKYNLNGSTVSETISSIDARDTITYTFTTKANLAMAQDYELNVWVDFSTDANPLNDSIANFTFSSKPFVSSFPYVESFENGPAGWHAEGQNSSWSQGTPGQFASIDNAGSGSKMWTTNLDGNHNYDEISYLISPCFDFRNVESNPFLEFLHAYDISGWAQYYVEYSVNGTTWSKLGQNGTNPTWYNESHYFDGYNVSWRKAKIEIPLQSISDSSSIKFRFTLYSDDNNWNLGAGIAIDSVRVYEIKNDLKLQSVYVENNACGLSSNEKLYAVVKNNSSSTQSNFQVKYKVNSGSTVSNSISASIASGATDTFELSNTTNFSSNGVYNVQAWIDHSADNYANNDTVQVPIISSAIVSNYPYNQDFESGNGGWFTDGDLWEVGVPNNTNISAAYGGTKALVTDLNGNYRNNDTQFVYSPCFDMSGFGANPTIKFYTKHRSPGWQDNLTVEYSDNGQNWFIAGAQLSGNYSSYYQRSYTIDLSNITDLENVKIRFAVRTNESNVDEGWAIDNIEFDGPSGNVGVVSIENPSSGCGNTGTTSITVKVANKGGAAQSNVPISYTINGANAVNETVSQIPARDTVSFTFNTTFTAVLGSAYAVKAYTSLLGDSDASDDTSAVEIVSNTSISSFPYKADFESNNNNFWTLGTNSSWEHGVPSDNRISAAAVGNKAWVTDLVRNHNQAEESFLNTPCFDLSGLNGDVWVRFYHFRSFNTGSNAVLEYSDNDGATWTKLGSTNSGTNWYNSLSQWSGFSSGWQHSAHLIPTGSIQNLEKVRFRFNFYGHPTYSPNEGFAIDEFEIFELTDDVELVETVTPLSSENVGQKTVEVRVANNMSYGLSNVPIKFQLDNNTVVSETINSIAANTTASFTFSTNLNIASTGNYVLKVWVDLNSDSYPVNDTSTTNITVQNLVNSFPYYEGFEADNGTWETTGTGTTWEWGQPNNTIINESAHGQKAWVTNLDGTNNASELSYLTSPIFDMRSISVNPLLSFYHKFDLGWSHKYYVEYSDDGQNWTKLGQNGGGYNWYNNASDYWHNTQNEWKQAEYSIPLNTIINKDKVQLRFVFEADQWNRREGIAIDDIFIGDKGTDLEVLTVTAPDTACGLSNSETVSISVKNYGASATGAYNVSYQLNGGIVVTEQMSSISSGAMASFSFSTKANVSSTGSHSIKVWTNLGADDYNLNDTFNYEFVHAPTINSFPYSENFESNNGGWYGGGNQNVFEWATPAGTNLNSASSGSKALVSNASGNIPNSTAIYLNSPCFDLSGFGSNPSLSFKMNRQLDWGNQAWVEYSEDGANWNKLGQNGSGMNWYNNSHYWNQNSSGYELCSYEIPLSGMTIKTAVKFRIVVNSDQWTNAEGLAIDDVNIQNIANDVEAVGFNMSATGAGLGMEIIEVSVKNNSASTQNNVFIYYQLNNNAPVKDTIPSISANTTASFSFTTKANLTANTSYQLSFWLAHSSDNYKINDTISGFEMTNIKYINSYPYYEDFETDNGTFYATGFNNTWEHGEPSSGNTHIKRAASGSKAWLTNLDGNFGNTEASYLYSPVFDLRSFSTNPYLSISLIYKLEWDATFIIEYSEDGQTWLNLPDASSGRNWQQWGFFNNKLHWHVASTEIPVSSMSTKDSVQFRIYFDAAWAFQYHEGVGIDNFHIHEKAEMHDGVNARNITSSANGSNWVHFTKNGKRVVSINPQGENLGNVNVTAYVNTGSIRNHNDQYILNRSWVVDPQNQPSNPVKVRLYMLDTEVDALMQASGCANCTAVDDAFKLTFTKYHGNNEDSVLTNNTSGTYQFFSSSNVKIVPYGKGYCVELTVSSFSEIFASGGGLGGNTALPVEFTYFDVQWLTSATLSGQNVQTERSRSQALLEWQTAIEENNSHFEVERSFDAMTWENIGKVAGKGTTFESTDYQFIDQLETVNCKLETVNCKLETVYYRLKQVDYNGQFEYTEIRTLSLLERSRSQNSFDVWPNPATSSRIYLSKSDDYTITNTMGKQVLRVENSNEIDISGLIKGTYLIIDSKGISHLLVIN